MRMFWISGTLALMSLGAAAQAPPSKAAPKVAARPAGTLAQVMRGIYFPNANLIFDVQQRDPAAPRAKSGDPGGSATDAYANT